MRGYSYEWIALPVLQGAHPHGDSCSRCGDSMEDMNEDGAAADAGDESSGGDSMGGRRKAPCPRGRVTTDTRRESNGSIDQ
jgi:hypothetical protein